MTTVWQNNAAEFATTRETRHAELVNEVLNDFETCLRAVKTHVGKVNEVEYAAYQLAMLGEK